MERNLRKISLTLEPELVDGLDYISGRLGVSRSALANVLLGEIVGTMVPLLQTVPLSPTEADLRRFRGESAELVRERIESLKGMANDLLSE